MPKNFPVIIFKIWTVWFYQRVMRTKDADRKAISEGPEQTAHSGWVYFVCTGIVCHNSLDHYSQGLEVMKFR